MIPAAKLISDRPRGGRADVRRRIFALRIQLKREARGHPAFLRISLRGFLMAAVINPGTICKLTRAGSRRDARPPSSQGHRCLDVEPRVLESPDGGWTFAGRA